MNISNIEKMSDEGAVKTVEQICDGIKRFISKNPKQAKELLVVMELELLDMLAADDFWGTEGWEHCFGIED